MMRVGAACSAVLLATRCPLAVSAQEEVCQALEGGCQKPAAESVLLQVHQNSRLLVAREAQQQQLKRVEDESTINVCYFTNWARYRGGLINTGKDVFEMDFPVELCSHFMYGFATVTPDFQIKSNDPNADHPSGSEAQGSLCDDACNDPAFTPDWSDANGARCDWPCSPTRVMRGYEAATVGVKRKNPGAKSLISVGGWNFNDCTASAADTVGQGAATCEIFTNIASSEANIRAFTKNVITFCRNWGFDGFDLDWEYPVVASHNSNVKENGAWKATTEDYANYINMLRIMREEFQKENSANPLLLTAAVGVGKSTTDTAYDIPKMNMYLDLINLMTYDLHGSWEPRTACNANLYATEEDTKLAEYPLSVSWAVDYWIQKGASPQKLTMGIGTYGRGWKLESMSNTGYLAPANGGSTAGASTKQAGYMAYYEVLDLINSGKATRYYDSERECPYVVTTDGEWIGYDDEQSVRAKLEVVKNRKLKGTMVWAIDLDDMTGEYSSGKRYPLTDILREAMLSGGSAPAPAPATTAATTAAPVTTAAPSTTAATTTKAPVPAPTTTGSSSSCKAVPVAGEASVGATDELCSAACAVIPSGTWPCLSSGPCACGGAAPTSAPSTTAPAPAPSSGSKDCTTCGNCAAVPGNAQGASDSHCAPCAMGGQTWWPCNVDGLCQCAA